jgi:predicted membrane-bound spermidine synthase
VRPVLFVVFTATGFSALTLQVVWQRVISLHAGVDLLAATTVVTAFLAGLGLGSLAGGALADRVGPRRSLLAFALSNAAVGAFAWGSLWLFYDVYRRFAAELGSPGAMFAFHFLLLAVPTTLMGLSLPLLARGAVTASPEIAPLVGKLYAVNTLGAAVGAAVAGWWLLGTFGFVASVRVAATLNLAAAAAVLLLWKMAPAAGPARNEDVAETSRDLDGDAGGERPWPWFLLYGLTGAVAIGLEIVYFRVVDAIWRNNSYTFASVLAIYLSLLAAGAGLGAGRARRAGRPDRWFLWLQLGVGASSLLGMLVLLHPPRAFGIAGFVSHYFRTLGYMAGDYAVHSAADAARLLYVHGVAPLLVMGAPVLLMGASFPFIQALVARRLDSLGRRTGTLLFSNIAGNVAGGAVTGFVLLERLGTSGTLQLLSGLLLLPGLAAAARLSTPRRRLAAALGAAGLMAAVLAAFPANDRFWAFFHSAPPERFELAEDRACVTSLVDIEDETFLYINGSWQNGHPYDSFHILIGLLPTLLHERPVRGLAVGLGIGSTAYSMAQDPRIRQVDCVEICGGEKRLIAALAARGSSASRRLLEDPRIRLLTGDGRRWLLAGREPYDVIVVDAVRPNTAYAGNLYSVEFYELVASRLAPDGVFVQWIPTDRVLNSVRRVFPQVLTTVVPEYNRSRLLIAGRQPLVFDRATLRKRLAAVDLGAAFDAQQRRRLIDFFATAELRRARHPRRVDRLPDPYFNHDLHPRDEYFLNDNWPEARKPARRGR